MNRLGALQRAFQRHIDRPGSVMADAVVAGPGASAERRLAVYATAYRARLVEALSKDYPVLNALLGDVAFGRMAHAFIAAHPSRQANLRWYGAPLGAFIACAPRLRRRPVLRDLARFEWALGLAFDAADAQRLTAGVLARTPADGWPGLRLRLHPSVQMLALRSNAPSIWQALEKGEKHPRARTRRKPRRWLIWRQDLTPCFRPLADDEAGALQALGRGRDFGAICAGLARFVGRERAAARAAQLLRNWIDEGVLQQGAIAAQLEK